MLEQQGEPMPMAHYPTPGLVLLPSTLPAAPVRGIRQASNGSVYAVAGDNLYVLNPDTWLTDFVGAITPGLTTPVSMADNGSDMILVDGSAYGWVIHLADNSFTPIGDAITLSLPPGNPGPPTGISTGIALYTPFTVPFSGQVATATVNLYLGYTGNLTCSLFSANGDGSPAEPIGFAVTIANPVTGDNTVTFATPVDVTAGTRYLLGIASDTSAGTFNLGGPNTGYGSTTPYASFPAAYPSVSTFGAPVCTITISNDTSGGFSGADKVEFFDTYFILNKPGTPQFYISGSNALTFDPLDFANKETASDLLVTLCVAKRELLLFGERTTEQWYDAGATDTAAGSFAFAEVQGAFIDHGCVAKYSVVTYDNAVFWLSRDRQGHGVVLMYLAGLTRRISTFPIEKEIASYARIDDAIAFTYTLSGHTFLVMTFPTGDRTWVCDISSITMTSPLIAPQPPFWHEWGWIDSNGAEHRHRANCFYPCNGTLVVGDWENGNLYALDKDVFTDNGQPIKRERSFPHLVSEGRRLFFREFLADMETGNGPAITDTNLISLSWSDDRGHHYGNPVAQSMGPLGVFQTSLQWQRLGMARDRVFKLSWTVNANTALQGCWLTVDMADADTPAPAQGQG